MALIWFWTLSVILYSKIHAEIISHCCFQLSVWLIQYCVAWYHFSSQFDPGRGNVWNAILTPDAWQYTCIQYTYSHRKGGGKSWTREKVRGAIVHKAGLKIPIWLTVSPVYINPINTCCKVPLQVIFLWRHFALESTYIVNKSMKLQLTNIAWLGENMYILLCREGFLFLPCNN